MPERHVRPELFHVRRQVQVGAGGYFAEERGIESLDLACAQAGLAGDLGQGDGARRPHRDDPLLGIFHGKLAHINHVAEDHFRVQRRAQAVGAKQLPIAADRDTAQGYRKLRAEQILLARAHAPQPLTVDHGAPHVHAAGMMLGERGNEAAIHRRQNRQVGGAIRRLGRLVVRLEYSGGQPIQEGPVALEKLTEAQGPGSGPGSAVQARFENRL